MCLFTASPSNIYNDVEEVKYFVISTPDTPVHVLCAIQPGALVGKYAVTRWTEISSSTFQLIQNHNFSIWPVVLPGQPAKFRCHVSIEHMLGIKEEYVGPIVTVNTAGKLF